MSNYVKSVNFAAKDALPGGDPNKTAKGTEVDTEFNNIATAVATKEDTANKNVSGGYPGLDGSTKISDSQLNTTIARVNAGTSSEIGLKIVPQNSQSGNYTLVIDDAAKHIFHPNGAGSGDTYTIPSNASVPFIVGTVLTFVNRDSNTVTIAIAGDTLILAGTGSSGNRTLGVNAVASAIKVEATVWIISGQGLS